MWIIYLAVWLIVAFFVALAIAPAVKRLGEQYPVPPGEEDWEK